MDEGHSDLITADQSITTLSPGYILSNYTSGGISRFTLFIFTPACKSALADSGTCVVLTSPVID